MADPVRPESHEVAEAVRAALIRHADHHPGLVRGSGEYYDAMAQAAIAAYREHVDLVPRAEVERAKERSRGWAIEAGEWEGKCKEARARVAELEAERDEWTKSFEEAHDEAEEFGLRLRAAEARCANLRAFVLAVSTSAPDVYVEEFAIEATRLLASFDASPASQKED